MTAPRTAVFARLGEGTLCDALDERDALRAENARLRGALQRACLTIEAGVRASEHQIVETLRDSRAAIARKVQS